MTVGLVACGSKEAAPDETKTPAATEETADKADEANDTATGDVQNYKIGVSIMELTAYTWYQGVIDGGKQWMADNGAADKVNFEFDFEDSRSDVQTMLTNVENMISAKW